MYVGMYVHVCVYVQVCICGGIAPMLAASLHQLLNVAHGGQKGRLVPKKACQGSYVYVCHVRIVSETDRQTDRQRKLERNTSAGRFPRVYCVYSLYVCMCAWLLCVYVSALALFLSLSLSLRRKPWDGPSMRLRNSQARWATRLRHSWLRAPALSTAATSGCMHICSREPRTHTCTLDGPLHLVKHGRPVRACVMVVCGSVRVVGAAELTDGLGQL
jgi:hypothetical protein